MAIKKAIMTRYGIEAEFWKIRSMENPPGLDGCEVHVDGWVSKQIRNAGYDPIDRKSLYSNADLSSKNDAYTFLLSTDTFTGGIEN